jgi:hypothetical protein
MQLLSLLWQFYSATPDDGSVLGLGDKAIPFGIEVAR